MERDDIIRMAREAGLAQWSEFAQADGFLFAMPDRIERFAALVAAAEREACARVCEETTASWSQYVYNSGCTDCAAAIRARGEA